MKKIFLLFLLFSSFAFAQMPNISTVWLNNSKPYFGKIANEDLKMKITVSEQNRKNDQEYFVSGYTVVNGGNYAKFEGKINLEKYKDRKKGGTVYGNYEFAEEPKGSHSGIFKGKFIYTFKWNKSSQTIENQEVQFTGDWKSYDGKMNYKTEIKNQQNTK